MKRRNRKLPRWIVAIQWLLALGLALALLVLIKWFQSERSTLKLAEVTKMYFVGTEYEFSDQAYLTSSEGKVYLTDGEETIRMFEIPLVGENGKRLMLPTNMAYNNPTVSSGACKVTAMGVINQSKNLITIDYSDHSSEVDGGFLYDGKDLFIFLEPMTVMVGESEYKVGELSYASVVYGQSMELYNSTDDFYDLISLGGSEVCAFSENGYSINLGTDVIKNGQNEWILFSGIDNLEIMK